VLDTAAESPENDDDSSTSDRGRRGLSFPTMALPEVVKIIHKAGGHGADFGLAAFAQYCGHTTANSGPFRTKLAAIRDWSMVTTKTGRVYLTALGKDVGRSEKPLEDQALLRRAFESCKIFKEFYDDQAKSLPIKLDVLGRGAVFDLNIAARSQERFVASLVDSAVAAGLATTDTENGTVTFGPVLDIAEIAEEEEVTDQTPEPTGTKGSAAKPTIHSNAPVLLRQVWPTSSGEVVFAIHSNEPLPASAFELVAVVVSAASELAEAIGPQTPAANDAA
jgi:hypothetical protein